LLSVFGRVGWGRAALLSLTLVSSLFLAASAQAYYVPFGSAALGAFAYHEIYAPTSVAGANNGCRPTAAHPYPVVLVHGTFEDEGSNWVTVAPLLANNGYCVYAFNYGESWLSFGGRVDGLNHIENSARELAGFVNWVLSVTGASKVDLVGHSQGGMMPNYYIRYLGGANKVNDFVALAPSNHGTNLDGLVTLADKVPGLGTVVGALSKVLGVPALTEQEENSAFINKLFGMGEPVVPQVHYTVIETEHDEVVTPYWNAFLEGENVEDILVQEQCGNDPVGHVGMIEDWPALQDMLNALSNDPNPNFWPACYNYGAPF